jgi:hypothetical protein
MTSLNNADDFVVATNTSNPVQAQPISWEAMRDALHNRDTERLQQYERDSVRDVATGRIARGPTSSDLGLRVTFSKERVYSPYLTYTNGEPTWDLKDFITIIPPGKEKELTRHSLVEPIDMWRFPKEWEAYTKGLKDVSIETDLTEWSEIKTDAGFVKELNNIGIYTVEALASTSDQAGGTLIRAFQQWKAKAKHFVDGKNKSEATVTLENKLEAQRIKHEAEMQRLQDMVSQLVTQLSANANTAATGPNVVSAELTAATTSNVIPAESPVLGGNTLKKKSTYKRKTPKATEI